MMMKMTLNEYNEHDNDRHNDYDVVYYNNYLDDYRNSLRYSPGQTF